MWQDDEGDDAAGSGERPDPSTRHWRHPSELAQQGALPHSRQTPAGAALHPSAGPATVWPLIAVGGCLAIVALGVIGLQADLGETGSLQVGSAATVAPLPSTASTTSASSTSTIDRSPDDPAGGAAWGSTLQPTTSVLAPRHTPDTSNPSSGNGPDIPPGDLLEASPLAAEASAPVYGVYAAPGRDDGLIGSFTMIGDDPVTSSSSLDGRSTVWLRIGSAWLEAVVVAEDPITDVALLDVTEDLVTLGEIELPTLPLADHSPAIGAAAMVGYGDPGLDPGDDPDDDAGDDAGDDADDGVDEPADQPSSETAKADDGDTSLRERLVPGPTAQPEEPSEATKAWIGGSDRRGVIYSLTKTLTTGSGHLIHDPIRLTTAPGPSDAGAPLRNQDGDVIGLVAHSDLPKVAAIPIDRVIDVVDWLQQTGVGDPAWLGLSVAKESGGLVITAIDEASPAIELAVGDRIVAIDHQRVAHPDDLEFATRLAGPGNVIEVTFDRGHRRWTLAVDVGTIPLP